MLIEPFLITSYNLNNNLEDVRNSRSYLRLVQMKIRSRIRSPNDHHREILSLVDTEVSHWRFEEMRVLLQPFREVDGVGDRHFG